MCTLTLKEAEDVLIRQYLSKGLKLKLREQTSVVNKKIDIFLSGNSGFSRSKFFQKMEGVVEKKLLNHVISIDKIRSNGNSENVLVKKD